MAGHAWAANNLKCSDMSSLIGNNIAAVVFDAAKAIDRVMIIVYGSAAGRGILSWLTGAVNKLITALVNAVYFPYLAPVVILGAIWLAWRGLIRKCATRSIEGTRWMVVACAAAICLIGRPADFTGFGKTVSDGIIQTLNVAFAKLPARNRPVVSRCIAVTRGPPTGGSYNYTSGTGVVEANPNELWTVLVCKPWLDSEFGTVAYPLPRERKPTVVNFYSRQLMRAQAIAANEKATPDVIQAKEDTYAGIANAIQQHRPGVYPLFQSRQWTTRLEIAFAALPAGCSFADRDHAYRLEAGLPAALGGRPVLPDRRHPSRLRAGSSRCVAELLIGVLLIQGAIALVLSVLLYAYSLIRAPATRFSRGR
jgi:hypothetical protein